MILYFTYWVLNIIINSFHLLAGRSALDIWWWPFWGWGFLCMVSVDSAWWRGVYDYKILWICTTYVDHIKHIEDASFKKLFWSIWSVLGDLYFSFKGTRLKKWRFSCLNMFINLQTPNVNYSWRTAPLTSKNAFYIFIQQI